jgi:hypothetical protein
MIITVTRVPWDDVGLDLPVNAHAIWRHSNQGICQLPDPITRESRAACTMSALTSSTQLSVMIRRIFANRGGSANLHRLLSGVSA